ncbi:hypothetical protein pdam_00020003 [Pocillopora damicornis]|uniref:Uncharacterized protein n=1 Tax=Pocillopora damicornis TaxID=46731 RepID=A0A3M6TU04_POCDA|nr:hypothetical protein pdam_00020003 [Pocillopora damicornis]
MLHNVRSLRSSRYEAHGKFGEHKRCPSKLEAVVHTNFEVMAACKEGNIPGTKPKVLICLKEPPTSMRVDRFASCENMDPRFQTPSIPHPTLVPVLSERMLPKLPHLELDLECLEIVVKRKCNAVNSDTHLIAMNPNGTVGR